MIIRLKNEKIYDGLDYPYVAIGSTLDRGGGKLVIVTDEVTDMETGERTLTVESYSKALKKKYSRRRGVNVFFWGYNKNVTGKGDISIFNRNKAIPELKEIKCQTK